MTEPLLRLEYDGLQLVVTRSGSSGTVAWLGASDSRNPSAFLEPAFARILRKLEGCTITIDFTGLEYMNSSTVSPIISLLKKLDQEAINSRVLFSDIDWQRTHLRCMRTITRVLPHVRVEAK